MAAIAWRKKQFRSYFVGEENYNKFHQLTARLLEAPTEKIMRLVQESIAVWLLSVGEVRAAGWWRTHHMGEFGNVSNASAGYCGTNMASGIPTPQFLASLEKRQLIDTFEKFQEAVRPVQAKYNMLFNDTDNFLEENPGVDAEKILDIMDSHVRRVQLVVLFMSAMCPLTYAYLFAESCQINSSLEA